MIKHFLFLLLLFTLQNKSVAQTAIKPQWAIPPIVDTLTEEMKHNLSFIFKANNKYGYFAQNRITIQAKYDSLWINNELPELIFVRLKGKLGMYKMYDTFTTISCNYDQINYIKKKGVFELIKGTQKSWYPTNPEDMISDEGMIFIGDTEIIYDTPPPLIEDYEHRETNKRSATHTIQDSLKKYSYEYAYNFTSDLQIYYSGRPNKLYKVYSNSGKTFLNEEPFDVVVPDGKFLVCSYRKKFSKTIVYDQQGKAILEYANEKTIYFDSLNNNVKKTYRCFQLDAQNSQSLYIYDIQYVRVLDIPFVKVVFNKHPALASCYDQSGEEKLYNLITGKTVPFKASQVTYFHPSYRNVFVYDGKGFFWNLKNDTYQEVPFSKIEHWYLYPNNGAIVRSNNGYALFNLDSLKFMTPVYDTICTLPKTNIYDSPDLSQLLYKMNGKYGTISTRGKILTKPLYHQVEVNFFHGYPSYIFHYDHVMTLLFRKLILDSITDYHSPGINSNYLFYKKEGKWRLSHLLTETVINATGDTFYMVPYSYDYLIVFKQETSLLVLDAYLNKYEAITLDADTILRLNEEEHPVLVITKRKGKYGLASHRKQIFPNKYDTVKPIARSVIALTENNTSLVLYYENERRNLLFNIDYTDCFAETKGMIWFKQNGKWGLVTY